MKWVGWWDILDDRRQNHRELRVKVSRAWEEDRREVERRLEGCVGREDGVAGWELVVKVRVDVLVVDES